MSSRATVATAVERNATGMTPRAWLAVGAILAAVVLAYANALSGPYVFDDLDALRDNASLRGSWWRAFSPPARTTVAGRPLLNVSFALSGALDRTSTVGHHLVNVAIHAAAALVLFGLWRRLLQARERKGGSDLTAALPAAVIAGWWAVHPLQTEAVTYLVQRAESLMALWYLLTLYCFVRGIAAAGALPRRTWFGLSIVACAAGMATKEVMVSAPLLVLLCDRVFCADGYRALWRRRWPWYLALAATWLILIALVLAAGGNRGGSIGFGVGIGWWQHAETQFGAVLHYLRMSVWPFPLVFEYEPVWTSGWAVVAPALIVAALVVATLVALRRARPAGFAGALFFAILAPTSLLPAPTELIVEHRMYLPLAAVLGLLLVAMGRAVGRALIGPAVLAGVALLALTHVRNAAYASELRLWQDTVAKRPRNALAHASLGTAWLRFGNAAAAVSECETAVRLDPTRPQYRYNLAQALERVGRTDEALAAYAEVIRRDPSYVAAHDNYAALLVRIGRAADARREWEEALRLQPDDALAHYNLGVLLSDTGDAAGAIEQFQAAVRDNPRFGAAYVRWGTTLAISGRIPEALERYDEAVRIDPENVAARTKRGLVLLMVGKVDEAEGAFEEALRLDPTNADAAQGLAMAKRQRAR